MASPLTRQITSPANSLVRELAELKERRERERTGTYLIEGVREVERAVSAGIELRRLLFAPELLRDAGRLARLVKAAAYAEVIELSASAFNRLSRRQNPDGLAAQAVCASTTLADLEFGGDSLLLVVDGLEKPGNLGGLLRTADAAAVDAVVVTGGEAGTDVYNPNVIRASQGSFFSLPLVTATVEECATALRSAGVRLIATTPEGEKSHWDVSYLGAVAVLVGAERYGLDPRWLELADERVKIPMRASLADSLNASVAGALVLYEAFRQRRLEPASSPAGS